MAFTSSLTRSVTWARRYCFSISFATTFVPLHQLSLIKVCRIRGFGGFIYTIFDKSQNITRDNCLKLIKKILRANLLTV